MLSHDVRHDLWHLESAPHSAILCGMRTPVTSNAVTPTPVDPQHHSTRRPATWHFIRHYLEMVVAMLVGMAVLGPLWTMLAPGLTDGVVAMVLVMATDMAIGMAAWMRIQRHSWMSIAQMSASMYLPFVVLLVPYWAGAISADTLMIAGHLLMLPLMAVAMLLRPSDYQH